MYNEATTGIYHIQKAIDALTGIVMMAGHIQDERMFELISELEELRKELAYRIFRG